MKRISLEQAYVLHRRPYRETSFLLELFSEEQGRFSVVARGVRKVHSKTAGLLQAFVPLRISCAGKGELLTLTAVEANGAAAQLQGDCLFAGFYLNELLLCLLQKWDAHPHLYGLYHETLRALQISPLEQKTLRRFESGLLAELGYGLLPKTEISLHNTFSSDKYYRFTPDAGFVLCDGGSTLANVFAGKSLLAIAKEDWYEESLRDAKRLTRLVLAPLLGSRPLHSRRLFIELNEENKRGE